MFNVPIVIFLFRRKNTLPAILERVSAVKPRKIYIMADCGRNDEETVESDKARKLVESLITWDCEIIKNYAPKNRGVYQNIGLGAKWVFEREKMAIFIEDDNLPEISFFYYAEELLEKYKDHQSVIWICGTNYYCDIHSEFSYFYTNQLLPCGWASWSGKFLNYYDGELELFKIRSLRRKFIKSYRDKLFGHYQLQLIKNEYYRKKKEKRFASWDYQMLWSIRINGLIGVAPSFNQITNIGVDDFSIHGGNAKTNQLTNSFCDVPSKPMIFPLKAPNSIKICHREDDLIASIIKPPKKAMLKMIFGSKIKHLLGADASTKWENVFHGSHKNK